MKSKTKINFVEEVLLVGSIKLTASVLMQYVIITWVYTAELALAWSQ